MPPKKAPQQGWCAGSCRPRKPAQSGYRDNRGRLLCKACFKKVLPVEYAEKQRARLKQCPLCGETKNFVGDLCKPCRRGQIAAPVSAEPVIGCEYCQASADHDLVRYKCGSPACATPFYMCRACQSVHSLCSAAVGVHCKACWQEGGSLCFICRRARARKNLEKRRCCWSCYSRWSCEDCGALPEDPASPTCDSCQKSLATWCGRCRSEEELLSGGAAPVQDRLLEDRGHSLGPWERGEGPDGEGGGGPARVR